MRLKKGVSITGIRGEILFALMVADGIWKDLGEELVITSLNDGEHSLTSFHYNFLGVDLRTRYFNNTQKQEAHDKLSYALGQDYDVILEEDHMHIEHQPRRRV